MLSYLLLFFFALSTFAKESIKSDHVEIDLLTPDTFAANQETLIGFHFRPEKGWHVYWKNPGDSGAATKFQFSSHQVQVGATLWPYPKRLPVAHLTNIGYENEVVYLVPIQTKSVEKVELKVQLEWLVCKEDCVPGFGELALSRPVVGKTSSFKPQVEKLINNYKNKLPASGSTSPYNLTLKIHNDEYLQVDLKSKNELPKDIDIFPVEPEVLSPGQPLIKKTEDSYQIQFQISATAPHAKTLSFVLVADGKAYEFTNLPVSTLSPAESTSLASLLSLLFFAFLGGTLLNLMPCVFPIIFIKAFAFLKLQDSRAKIKDGVLYTLGVLTTFTALGILFLMLKQMGMSVGWGFQLQSPLVILFLIILFWLMALNFLGVFEFGTQIMNTTGNISWRTSFGTGVLSVFIAAPCTGPFMGTALGATATLPHFQALLIFIFLGLGLAFPYFLLSLKPQLANYLPKPGPWMETIKQFFAFPLFATVLWLLWVLGQQIGTEGWFYSGLILLVISFTLWVNSKNIKVGKYFLWALTILLIGLATYQVYNTDKSNNLSHSKSKWTDYSPDKLKAALDSGQSVFIDFTAAWCITCQVNKKLVLDTPEADLIFKDANILRMRADWTNYDPQITLALKKLGRNSVPVYAFYTTGGLTPQILPQILTISNLRHLISNKEEK